MKMTGSLFLMKYSQVWAEQANSLLTNITNLTPDILCLAKGLGNGVPIGACLAKERLLKCLLMEATAQLLEGIL